jgi:hypothetical protein
MDKKRKDGYVTGLVCLIIFAIFLPTAINIGWNTSGQIFWVFTIVFGGLGVGSLWKPESIGAVVSQLLKNLAESEEKSDSHNKQIQKESSGSVQVMASDEAEVNINVPSAEKKQAEKPSAEEKEILRKETIVVSPSKGYSYEVELMKGEHLKGEISSNSCIDIYFVDEFNFDKWNRGKKSFDYEDSNEGILETNIDYVAPKKGKWYLIIENNGRKSATVKVRLY